MNDELIAGNWYKCTDGTVYFYRGTENHITWDDDQLGKISTNGPSIKDFTPQVVMPRDEVERLVEIAEENRTRVMNETFKHEHPARLDYLFSIDSHTSLIQDIKKRLGM